MFTTVTVDIGTSGIKLGVLDPASRSLASASSATPTIRDEDGEIYDLAALTATIVDFISALDPGVRASVERIAITGVGESGGLVRSDLTLASPMILWHDQRGAGLLKPLSSAERSLLYSITGLPASGNYGLSKAAWAVNAAGDALGDAQWLNISEYIAAWMTGTRWSEYSLASRTMALDLRTRTWSKTACLLLGVPAGIFPELRRAGSGAPVRPGFAGLPDSVLVHVAGHDHMVGGVGADLRPGELLASTGTTEGVLFLAGAPSLGHDAELAKLANGIAPGGNDATLFASIPTGGSAFATLRTLLSIDAAELERRVDSIHDQYVDGRMDLDRIPLVLPRFRGSPPPTKDPRTRGAIDGISSDTTADELILGCFLGLAAQFLDVLELFPQRPDVVKVIGPAARNPLWLQLKADLLGMPLSTTTVQEVVSRGAQALASGTVGDWTSCDPRAIAADPLRHSQLAAWRERSRPRWDHLKAMPL